MKFSVNFGLSLLATAISVVGFGCGSKSTTTTTTAPTIVTSNGYKGYYLNNQFCDWANDYCNTGKSYGIAVPVVTLSGGYYGYYSGTVFCNFGNDYCGTGLSWGIIDNGTVCDYTYCGGTVGSAGTSSGGIYGSSGGSTGGSTGGSSGSSGGGSGGGSSGGDSFATGTKDVDLQQAQLEQGQVEGRAQALASEFSMNLESARQLTQISDRMQIMQQQGAMTDEDREAVADAALGVAGISQDQVTDAYARYLKGDHASVDNLVYQASQNLGMPSSYGLREQILPSLGINLGQ